jgi:hypothetical protein
VDRKEAYHKDTQNGWNGLKNTFYGILLETHFLINAKPVLAHVSIKHGSMLKKSREGA